MESVQSNLLIPSKFEDLYADDDTEVVDRG
jgi:hypothetical protein